MSANPSNHAAIVKCTLTNDTGNKNPPLNLDPDSPPVINSGSETVLQYPQRVPPGPSDTTGRIQAASNAAGIMSALVFVIVVDGLDSNQKRRIVVHLKWVDGGNVGEKKTSVAITFPSVGRGDSSTPRDLTAGYDVGWPWSKATDNRDRMTRYFSIKLGRGWRNFKVKADTPKESRRGPCLVEVEVSKLLPDEPGCIYATQSASVWGLATKDWRQDFEDGF